MRFRLVMRAFLATVLILISLTAVVLVAGKSGVLGSRARVVSHQAAEVIAPLPKPTRPYGMAPVAWEAYLRACHRAKIHSFRIGQTIGDHPRSVGYHKRDGVVRVRGQKMDYCAAIDLGTWDLTPQQIRIFVDALASQGFAAFYRSGGKWKGAEHIHAIYAFLPMKPQLQIQVGEFLRNRRREGRRVAWEKKLRKQRTKLRHWML